MNKEEIQSIKQKIAEVENYLRKCLDREKTRKGHRGIVLSDKQMLDKFIRVASTSIYKLSKLVEHIQYEEFLAWGMESDILKKLQKNMSLAQEYQKILDENMLY